MMASIKFDDGKEVTLSKETTKRLRKELLKPEWKHGDVVETYSRLKRIILRVDGVLKSFDSSGSCHAGAPYTVSLEEGAKSAEYKKLYNVFERN